MGLLSAGGKGWPGGGRDDRSLVLQGGGGGHSAAGTAGIDLNYWKSIYTSPRPNTLVPTVNKLRKNINVVYLSLQTVIHM